MTTVLDAWSHLQTLERYCLQTFLYCFVQLCYVSLLCVCALCFGVKLKFRRLSTWEFRASFRALVPELSTTSPVLLAVLFPCVPQLVKLSVAMIDAGKAYNTANRQFVSGIRELAQQSVKDEVIEVSGFVPILFDQAQRSIKSQLQTFVKEDLRRFKETKKQFDKVSEEKEAALSRNAQAPRNKQHEVEEAASILTATRKCFRHIVLDYVLQINVLQSKRRSEILKSMLSFMYAHLTFFHQGYDLFSELQPLMKHLLLLLCRHWCVFWSTYQACALLCSQDYSNDDTKLEYNVDADSGIVMEGYLFKRASNAFKTWNRRWFSIQNNQLVYQKKFKDNPTVVVEDLRLCTVKHCEDIERRFCFEVVSPTKSCMMQADSEKLRQAWIRAVQNSIATAFRDRSDDSEKLDRKSSPSTSSLDSEPREKSLKGEGALQKVMAIAGNSTCCDCDQLEPKWASINLGITLCIQCSGIHRSLGVHFSKVRSLTLDTWEPELLKLMCELGNGVINQIYEARREELGARKPQPGDPRQEVEAYIRAKYVDRRFIRRPSDEELKLKVVTLCKQGKRLSFSSEPQPPRAPPPTPKARPASGTSGGCCLSSASGLEEAWHESLFCADELDSLFSYFDTSGRLQKSADSGILNSAEGSREVLFLARHFFPVSVCDMRLWGVAEAAEHQPASGSKEQVMFSEPKHYCPGLQLYWAAFTRSLPNMAEALAHGAQVNWINTEEEKRTPLIMAVQGGSLVTCEFLLQNSASVNQQDSQGRGPLHHATILGHTGQVCLFLKRGANQNASDIEDKTPLSIAVEAVNADIVTLLRLAKMNEEMRESEGPYNATGQYSSNSPTDVQYRKCIEEFIGLQLGEHLLTIFYRIYPMYLCKRFWS
uniref:Arf-GAP with coiled-coil, ANK repeat and PH domain-containing protein n=1 Tax=Electrophorus electricus TaxID=8005 RepID=A0A4W4FZZ4_ELEEL